MSYPYMVIIDFNQLLYILLPSYSWFSPLHLTTNVFDTSFVKILARERKSENRHDRHFLRRYLCDGNNGTKTLS